MKRKYLALMLGTLIGAGSVPLAQAGPEIIMTRAEFEAAQDKPSYNFAGYPSKNKYRGHNAKLDMSVPFARNFRTRLRSVLVNKPNASRKFLTYGFGCGSSRCITAGVVDGNTGKPYPLGQIAMGCSDKENEIGDLLSGKNSDLLIAIGCMDERLTGGKYDVSQYGYHYFKINNGKFRHIRSVRVVD